MKAEENETMRRDYRAFSKLGAEQSHASITRLHNMLINCGPVIRVTKLLRKLIKQKLVKTLLSQYVRWLNQCRVPVNCTHTTENTYERISFNVFLLKIENIPTYTFSISRCINEML